MKFNSVIFAFWLYQIHPNRRIIQHLLCNDLERHYNPLLREAKRGADLYSSILSTAPEIGICPCSGMMMTPGGLIIVPEESWHTSHIFPIRPRSLHLAASSKLLKMLHILSMSSSILLPRLLQGIPDLCNKRKTFEAEIILRVITKISSPILKEQSFDSLFHLFRSESPSIRPVCEVPLHHIGRALLSEESAMRSQHLGVRMMLHAFQHANPFFLLSEQEILELIFWAFFEQERLQNLDAALFGLPPQSRLSWDNVLKMDYTKILQEANQGGLLNRALHFSAQKKREHLEKQRRVEIKEQLEKQRRVEIKEQVQSILEDIIYTVVSSSECANLPATNANKKIVSVSVSVSVKDAVPHD
jgi:hypothetical protein